MVGRQDFMEVGTMLVGAAGGAAISRYGSNAISDMLTKKDRDAAVAVKDIDIWKKAPVVDIALGTVAGLVGMYAVKGSSKTSKMTSTALKSAGVYLVGNGVLDLVGDITAEETERQANGRPLHYTGTFGQVGRVALGAQRRSTAQRLNSQAFVPSSSRGRVAMF